MEEGRPTRHDYNPLKTVRGAEDSVEESDASSGDLQHQLEKLRGGLDSTQSLSRDQEVESDPTNDESLPDNAVPDDPVVPGKFINIIINKQNLFRVNLNVNGVLLPAVIDTGAACSLISSKVVENSNFRVFPTINKFDALGSDKFESIGSIKAEIIISQVAMSPLEVAVFPADINSGVQLLLGVDFLRAF